MKIKLTKRSKLMFAYFASMVGLLLLNIILNVVPTTLSDNAIDILFTLISQILCMGLIPFTIALFARKSKDENVLCATKSLLTDFGYKTKLNWKQLLLLIPLAVSFYWLTKLMSSITVLVLLIAQYQLPIVSPTHYGNVGDLFKWIAITALLPAIFEEFTHRGLLIDALRNRGSEASIVVLSALMFALMHTNIIQCIYAFVGGCVLGYIAVRTKSIYPTMILHFANNTFATIEDYASQHADGLLGFLPRMTDFWSTNMMTMLLRGVLLVANVFLFIIILNAFIKSTPSRQVIKGRCIPKTQIDIDFYSIEGKPTLLDNFMMYGTIAMCALSTFFSYIWGLLR